MKRIGLATMLMTSSALVCATAATMPNNANLSQAALPQVKDSWYQSGQQALAAAKAKRPIDKPAKNIILFIGDGMSVGTLTAARIYQGQQQGMTGEEHSLVLESLPHVALSKTYNTDMQTPDSAGTATAMVAGVKTKAGVISGNDKVQRGFCNTLKGNQVETLFESAAQQGRAIGVVSTARITHATPATAYAHSADRGWENDAAMTPIAKKQGCVDIAQQLVDFDWGNGLEVVLGGGRRELMLNSQNDPEYADKKGKRKDGQDLIAQWQQRYPQGEYVWNKAGFDAVSKNLPERVLGLFEPSHMQYEADRDSSKEPSLAEMTKLAVEMLSRDQQGYVLMVEAGRIDHAHHAGNAARALQDTLAFDAAIAQALAMTNPQETLIIVTADHAHTLIANGYADRGNPILGLSKKQGKLNLGDDGKPYTTLAYGNGPGAQAGERSKLNEQQVQQLDYLQQALVPLAASETHSGEDVAILASGPKAWLFQGVVEQHYIYHVMREALGMNAAP
ncbi:Alkaline phosphatase [Vibrio stylophorae]|uniref:Alkaline phosphatase n=1 Tax=Vibrio stylophorae TaxID=659351 RepID=A0ABM8ZWB9_9VIBR|nr:alkaline phosphatase [Vibrio stylophorae]CAH0534638.1 Alkaline phosphatase [Vibrio stylophorae]